MEANREKLAELILMKLQDAKNEAYFHVTSFYGRPEEPVKDVLLRMDAKFRNLVRKLTGKRLVPTTHL